jgi:hypothetical protein
MSTCCHAPHRGDHAPYSQKFYASNKLFLLEVAFVMAYFYSNRKVTKTKIEHFDFLSIYCTFLHEVNSIPLKFFSKIIVFIYIISSCHLSLSLSLSFSLSLSLFETLYSDSWGKVIEVHTVCCPAQGRP